MKKIALCLGILQSSIAFASCDYDCEYHAPSRCEITEGYTLPVYDLECDWGLYIVADFLYWYGRDSNLIFAQETEGIRVIELDSGFLVPAFFNLPTKNRRFSQHYWPAFRIGLGSHWSSDGWDTLVDWTYYHTKNHQSKSVDPLQLGVATDFLLSPWTNPLFGTDLDFAATGIAFFGFAPIYTTIKAKWKERLNIIDFEIGRNFWLSKLMKMRPYIGVRGAWDRNTFSVNNILESTIGIISSDNVHFKNKYWGVGLLTGVQPSFSFCNGFSLFGNLDGSLIWGKFRIKRRESITNRLLSLTTSPFIIPHMKEKFSGMQAILDLAAGVRFDSNFCCDRYYLALDVGWEQHYWFNHFCRYKLKGGLGGLSRDSGFTELHFLTSEWDEVYGDFTFGGIFVGLRVDF